VKRLDFNLRLQHLDQSSHWHTARKRI